MNRAKGTRARLGVLLAAALGALALLALPSLAASRDGGGHHHSHHGNRQPGNAGTIASFDPATSRLTIDLFGTDTVSGLVTDRTRIRCEDEHSPDLSERHRHGEAEPGDDNGTGANCTSSDLIVGAVVRKAELEIEHGTATFEEVELAD